LKVLFLCQRVPYPPDRGDRITTFHFLQHFLARDASIRLGCLAEEEKDLEAIAELDRRGIEVCSPRMHPTLCRLGSLRGLLTGEPLSLPYFRNRVLALAVRTWLRDDPPDLVYVYSSSMAQYVVEHRTAVRVMQFAELDSDKWRQYAKNSGLVSRWIYQREARLLLEYERRVATEFDVSFVVSPVEKHLFTEQIPEIEPVVLPNGVDLDKFQSSGDDRRDPHTLIFTGVMDYRPNVDGVLWFTECCWPEVRSRFPDARFLVVGSRPSAALRALDGHNGIEVTGRVAETQPWFDRAALAIAPLRMARGIQNKVLEAMCMGLPVVGSTSAVQGLASHGEEVQVADNPGDTTAAVIRLMDDPELARELGRRARKFVGKHYRWQDMFTILDRELDRLMK
jgi:sugar transferase (PEP-CTERM/EpsH1 system associated)